MKCREDVGKLSRIKQKSLENQQINKALSTRDGT
jgi:hypothetical protein